MVLIDNGSTDGTAAVARDVAAGLGLGDRLEVHEYPFAVARCGGDHLATAAASVHSLAYFYNWSFAHVRTSYALKWDADMVLTDVAAGLLGDLAWQLEAADAVLKVPRLPLYVGPDRAFLDTGLRNCEPWAWPNRPGFSFAKALDWELPAVGRRRRRAHAARLGLRRAQAPRRGRVRPLVAHGLRRVGADAAQGPRVGRVPRARGGRCAAARRGRDRRAARRPR